MVAGWPAGHSSDRSRGISGQEDIILPRGRSVEEIKRDYTPRNIHEKSYDELRADIKKIMENFLTREDFFREHAKVDRKIDMLLDFEIKRKGTGI